MTGATPRRIQDFIFRRLRLRSYFNRPGDGRDRPAIPARALMWGLFFGHFLRVPSYHAIEGLARSGARKALAITRRFSNDTLAYFTERLDPEELRRALGSVLCRAKRNKAFEGSGFIGLAVDGTGAGHSAESTCRYCRAASWAGEQVVGYGHRLSVISVVGTGISLPFDVEPYGPGGCEYVASQTLLARAVGHLGRRFADYVVGDGEYATAPFVHCAGALGLRVVVRLKGNLPELQRAVEERFGSVAPTDVFWAGRDRVEVWDADDFDPWEALRWTTVRVIRYRQYKSDGTIIIADWLTDWPREEAGSRAVFHMAKSRWEIENQTFNVGKNLYGMEHIAHHHENSLLIGWLLTLLAITVERLYRLRYAHRGTHSACSAAELLRALWLNLRAPVLRDTS